jgi:hypothetical protein
MPPVAALNEMVNVFDVPAARFEKVAAELEIEPDPE